MRPATRMRAQMTTAMKSAELISCQAGAAPSATRYVITIGADGGKIGGSAPLATPASGNPAGRARLEPGPVKTPRLTTSAPSSSTSANTDSQDGAGWVEPTVHDRNVAPCGECETEAVAHPPPTLWRTQVAADQPSDRGRRQHRRRFPYRIGETAARSGPGHRPAAHRRATPHR